MVCEKNSQYSDHIFDLLLYKLKYADAGRVYTNCKGDGQQYSLSSDAFDERLVCSSTIINVFVALYGFYAKPEAES